MLENFCCDNIWSLNETWNTFVPDFTSCFQDVVLVLVPCIVFSVTGLFNLYLLSRHNSSAPLPWTWRLILKLILGIFLFTTSVSWCSVFVYKKYSDGSDSVPLSTMTASFARCFTYVIVIVLMMKHRTHGIATSTVLSLFWITFTSCGIILHRSIIIKQKDRAFPPDWNFIYGMLYYPVIYLQFILSLFADVKTFTLLERGNPLEEEPFLSGITFIWFSTTVYKGLKRLLTVKDFFPLPVKLKASYLYEIFSKHWNFNSSVPDFQKQSLVWALFKSFWPWLFAALALDILYVLCLLMPPLILEEILLFVKDDHYLWRISFYCAIIFIVSFLGRMLQNNYGLYILCLANQVKSALITAVYRKNLSLASASRKNYSSGSITSLISVDVARISNFALYATSLLSSPFRIIVVLFLMWKYLGPSSLAAVAVIILLFPITFYMSRISGRLTDRQMEVKDFRLKYINEILSGIKILKFYAWEVPFSLKLLQTRKREIKLIRLSQICFIFISFVYACAPVLVAIASFTTYLLIDFRHILDPTHAFVSLNLMDQLRIALFAVPDAIAELIQTITAIGRIRSFLVSEEMDPTIVGSDTDEGEAVTINDCNFFWSKEGNFVLDNINLHVPDRKLIAVIGPVGSGKTSLLSAILGDMYKSSGCISVKGSIAYVPQEAWILNRTLKNNILLEKLMVEEKYRKILDCCCLRPDLEILPGRDETEIGEKGINLSGGQKQRVSLARSLFQNRDIYLLDDPLSAVDAHVRKALFEDVIGNGGLLKNKTRILVTHDVSFLPQMDLIIRMEEGKILEIGTYKELMDGSETFLNYIKTHAGSNGLDSGDNSANNQITEEITKDKVSNAGTITHDVAKPSSQIAGTNLTEDETMEKGGVKRFIYLNYVKHIGGLLFTLSIFGYIGFASFEASSKIWLAKWTADATLNGTQDASQTKYRLSVYGGLGLAQAITNVIGTACLIYGSTRAAELYHNQMLESVLKSPMSFFDVTPMGRIVNRFSTDMDTLDIHIIYSIDGWLYCLLYSLATFIVIGMNTPLFLACILPIGVLFYILLRLHLNTSRQIRRLESTTRSPMYSHMLESIYGALSIKAFELEKEFIEKLEENVDNHIACAFGIIICNSMKCGESIGMVQKIVHQIFESLYNGDGHNNAKSVKKKQVWLHFCMDIISCVIIVIATWLAIDNRHVLGASALGLVVTYALSVTDSLNWIVRTNNELENKSVAIERVDEYCKLQSEAPRHIPDGDPDDSWPRKGEIVFDDYCTRYRENLDLVLKNINLNVLPNEKVGIVGRTGAGKSSVTLALFRIVEPAQGTILIDNVDLTKIGLYALRSKLTIIPQDPVLFTGTLRFNLDPNDEYSDEDIWTSLSSAHLKDFVSGLSEGLQHNVDEGGGNLSAGQKQLLCLSRALLKKSKILILDEATAAVDMDTDKLVQDTIKTAFANHTVITIAHRLNTVMDYDKIVVMDVGEIVEVGSPASLLENQQSYFHQLSKEAGLI